MEAAGKKLQKAEQQFRDVVNPLQARLEEIKQAISGGGRAERQLWDTCNDEALVAELANVVNQSKAATTRANDRMIWLQLAAGQHHGTSARPPRGRLRCSSSRVLEIQSSGSSTLSSSCGAASATLPVATAASR